MISPEEIKGLGALARVAVSDEEASKFAVEFESILGYVSELNALTLPDSHAQSDAPINVLRGDVVTHEPGEFTEELLAAAPAKEGEHISVQKIIQQDE